MNPVENALKDARSRLVDLSLRNRLLNFKPTKRRTIQIGEGLPWEIYKAIVQDERRLWLLPKSVEESQNPTTKRRLRLVPKSAEESQNPTASEPDESVARREENISHEGRVSEEQDQTDKVDIPLRIETGYERTELLNRLAYCRQQARTVLEEQGYNPLHLALFFLRWSENPASKVTCLAPLVLVPVGLDRVRPDRYQAVWTKEEVQFNVALQVRLKEKQGIELPEVENTSNLRILKEYLKRVDEIFSQNEGWQIEPAIYLDFFNFTKIVMWKDLDWKCWPREASPLEHRVLEKLFCGKERDDLANRFPPDEVDTRLNLRDRYYVMDADPSQIAVIEDIRSGKDLVVEGPPGTGKSQTIVNVIGESLAAGKKILFVSEKMAALEVVKRRLDKVGLGGFCLELHSRKANKKDFVSELKKSLELEAPPPADLEGEFDEIERLTKRLNDYAESLRKPFAPLGESPFKLLGMVEKAKTHFNNVQRTMPAVCLDNARSCGPNEWQEAVQALEELRNVSAGLGRIRQNPWYGCAPVELNLDTRKELRSLIPDLRSAASLLKDKVEYWRQAGVNVPQDWTQIPRMIEGAGYICQSVPFRRIDPTLLHKTNLNLNKEQALALVDKLEEVQARLSALKALFRPIAFDSNNTSLISERALLASNWFMIRHPIKHVKLHRKLLGLYQKGTKRSWAEVLQDLSELANCLQSKREIEELRTLGRSFFGFHWLAERSDCKKLRDFQGWMDSFQSSVAGGNLDGTAVDTVCSSVEPQEWVMTLRELDDAWRLFSEKHQRIMVLLRPDYEKVFEQGTLKVGLQQLIPMFERWEQGLTKLREWSVYLMTREDCLRTIASPLVRLMENDEILPDDLLPLFEGSCAEVIYDEVLHERPALHKFSAVSHEASINHFAMLDRDLVKGNRKRLARKLHMDRPHIPDTPKRNSTEFKLKLEMRKRRGHLPIRKQFSEFGELLLGIKPCVMMSPLSASQFLEPGKVHFDLVVFDEASQVKPEDALGAILRGEQLVVIGDTNQLPPTNFFDRIMEEPDQPANAEWDDVILHDMESILHLCTISFPLGSLNWHYRSEHETLISVSNQEFYNNHLKVYPSPKERNEELGLHFEHVKEGTYDRGRSRTNRVEAIRVAQRVLDHYRRFPSLSLGVGTFNEAQRDCVLDEVEKLRRETPDLNQNLLHENTERFFVKNLETIQGDERDVIFISIGYGFDSDKNLSLNFGPLNQAGGERRLNVLISRARKKCIVFSNFEASDLTMGDSPSMGVKCLKVFLEYAQTGRLISDTILRDFDSPFEESVHRFLAGNGIVTHPQVGCAGYRIDLAVPHPNPTLPRQYLLGIECDGRPYHSSSVARERDRLRKQVLQDRGWTILNVWSTDWYFQRSQAESRLLNKVQDAIEQARRSAEPLQEMPAPEIEAGSSERSSLILEAETSPHGDLSTGRDASGIDQEKDITMPLLCFVYDNNEELRAGDSCHGLTEYIFLAAKESGDQDGSWPTNWTERIEWATNQLTKKGFLTKSGQDLWTITTEGKKALADLGCT